MYRYMKSTGTKKNQRVSRLRGFAQQANEEQGKTINRCIYRINGNNSSVNSVAGRADKEYYSVARPLRRRRE